MITSMEIILELLKNRNYEKIVLLCNEERRFWSFLKSRLYDPDILIKYRAVEAIGIYMNNLWNKNEEKVRTFIRTLLWSLNDESGGIGWSSAPAIAQIIIHIPSLKDPYLSMAMNALDEELLKKPILWAVAKVGKRAWDDVEFHKDNFLKTFCATDMETVGYATIAAIKTGYQESIEHILNFQKSVKNLNFQFPYFVDGFFVEQDLNSLINDAVSQLR
ncbi:MAG: DVU0298 family protein [Thermodesulfobium sp.]